MRAGSSEKAEPKAENPYRTPQHVDQSVLGPNRWLRFLAGLLANGVGFTVLSFWTFQRFLMAVFVQIIFVIVGFMRVRDKQMKLGFFMGVFATACLICSALLLFYGVLVLLGF